MTLDVMVVVVVIIFFNYFHEANVYCPLHMYSSIKLIRR